MRASGSSLPRTGADVAERAVELPLTDSIAAQQGDLGEMEGPGGQPTVEGHSLLLRRHLRPTGLSSFALAPPPQLVALSGEASF